MPEREPLNRIVIALEPFDEFVDRLKARFPDIEVAGSSQVDLPAKIAGADALICGFAALDEALPHADTLRWIQNTGAGVERLMTEQLRSRRLILTNGSGVMAPNMAEHIIAMMLHFARQMQSHHDARHDHVWREGFPRDRVFELNGQTAVLVGLGDIALETAARLKAFGMTIVGVRRSNTAKLPDHVDEVVPLGSLDKALARADHVIASIPSTPETRGLFNADRFAAFKPGAHFFNVGRGTAVVQQALIDALESGQVAGAGLDVTDPEPLPKDDPLWSAPNVLITRHTAGASPFFQQRLLALFEENVRRFQSGETLINVVDHDRGY